jgi:hypothetical protein
VTVELVVFVETVPLTYLAYVDKVVLKMGISSSVGALYSPLKTCLELNEA